MPNPWTNQVVSQVIVGQAPATQIEINTVGQTGQIIFLFNKTGFGNAIIEGQASTFASLVALGPAATAAGFTDAVGWELNSSDGASSFANMELFYVDTSATAHGFATMDGSGITLAVCKKIVATKPGTGTSQSNVATAESWHTATLQNSWTASSGVGGLFYRMLPLGDGLIEIIADIINTTATGNSVCATLPSGWRPGTAQNHPAGWNNPQATNSATVPWVNVATSGAIQVTGIEQADNEVFFHIFVPVDLTA